MCPSVLRDEARAAAIEALNRRAEIPTKDVIVMMDNVLENTFSFNDEHLRGMAMGSRLGLNYALTYMGAWEEELFRRSESNRSHTSGLWMLCWAYGRMVSRHLKLPHTRK
ncbi:hypothetical protein DPMN_026273 [Dreissena polymorpha]|uniref:Uncharacterized protein n=1 Tax=Dreissena polymorpha TaxID=45954 RepID=A0A9D4LT39_DREPO|nr:hypothetical protein DPMN_026273 [Dreissena polymorpha]